MPFPFSPICFAPSVPWRWERSSPPPTPFRNTTTKGFLTTLALLPAIVQMVIMLVNGNLGTGVAVMGAFSLIRFRSVPGTAGEICSIFLSMAVGLATGTGYLAAAVLFTLILELAGLFCTLLRFGASGQEKSLKITTRRIGLHRCIRRAD